LMKLFGLSWTMVGCVLALGATAACNAAARRRDRVGDVAAATAATAFRW